MNTLLWEEEQQLCHYEAARRVREREYQRRLAILTVKEAQRQRFQYENDFYRLWQRITFESPRSIAEFRLG
ncbi:unnamed protein product [Adineta steineri]|uniref:Uncharacterized protein n=1 Tax=Adineta steineri TaxID=433720 RepID=A0A815R2J0_9BILA|nr:unnamed protein product [Adineta steineri]CAF1635741.1 unnamed protein product [Adineta steineri]